MFCPACGTRLFLDAQSKSIDLALSVSTWGEVPKDCYRCKGCGLTRPDAFWEGLELDINTEIKFEETVKEEIPEELAGQVEHPWGD